MHSRFDPESLKAQRAARKMVQRDTGKLLLVFAAGCVVWLLLLVASPPVGMFFFLVFVPALLVVNNWRQWTALLVHQLTCPHCGQSLADRVHWFKSPSSRCSHCGQTALASIPELEASEHEATLMGGNHPALASASPLVANREPHRVQLKDKPELLLGAMFVSVLLLAGLNLVVVCLLLGVETTAWLNAFLIGNPLQWAFGAILGTFMGVGYVRYAIKIRDWQRDITLGLASPRPTNRSKSMRRKLPLREFVEVSLILPLFQLACDILFVVVPWLSKGLAFNARAELLHLSALGLAVGVTFSIMFALLWLGQVVAWIVYHP